MFLFYKFAAIFGHNLFGCQGMCEDFYRKKLSNCGIFIVMIYKVHLARRYIEEKNEERLIVTEVDRLKVEGTRPIEYFSLQPKYLISYERS
jgi:hypothetical protein